MPTDGSGSGIEDEWDSEHITRSSAKLFLVWEACSYGSKRIFSPAPLYPRLSPPDLNPALSDRLSYTFSCYGKDEEYPYALCSGPKVTVCTTTLPYCDKVYTLHNLGRCSKCLGFHTLEICQNNILSARHGATDHHAVLCTHSFQGPQCPLELPSIRLGPCGHGPQLGVGCSYASNFFT